MPYLKGDCVIPLGQVPHSGEHGVVVRTKEGDTQCLVHFEDGSQEEYDASVLTLTEIRWQSKIRGLVWGRM